MFLAVDGKFKIPNLDMEQEAIVGGDNKVLSIAAASIIAKVYRDALMKKFDETFKGYEFARHKGYATEYHRKMVLMYGLSPIHRISFYGYFWRRGRDSNPREAFAPAGFRNQCTRPLCDLSKKWLTYYNKKHYNRVEAAINIFNL